MRNSTTDIVVKQTQVSLSFLYLTNKAHAPKHVCTVWRALRTTIYQIAFLKRVVSFKETI